MPHITCITFALNLKNISIFSKYFRGCKINAWDFAVVVVVVVVV